MSKYEWKANICCIATYKVLEGDDNMDQFEESSISFEDAKDLKIESLRLFPKTTNNPDIIELIAFEAARKFLKMIVKGYSVKKEKSEITSSEIIIQLSSIFKNKEATINDIAEKVDSIIKFSDE
jgi:hypothetical protein